ncbi:MAG: hypothetical protein Roseis2KO_47150 [Roseivirga sp.]
MTKGKILFLSLALIALMISACDSDQPFDSDLWKQKGLDWWMTDVREKMVDDLVDSDTLISMSKTQVLALLGEPESEIETELEYLIREKYGRDVDPEYISTLKIKFNESGQVTSSEIEK